MMKLMNKIRRNDKRSPTDDEIMYYHNVDVEGNPNAKLSLGNNGDNVMDDDNNNDKRSKRYQKRLEKQRIMERRQQYGRQKNLKRVILSERWLNDPMSPRTNMENGNLDGNDGDFDLMVDGKPVYIVKQNRGYLSILFSVAQTGILIAMIIQCGIAPLKINPMVGPYPDALNYWGGKNAYYILYNQEYWRMVSPIMLHAGIFHLICNVAVQLDTGAFWEREWGSLVWLIIYLTSAVWGSILSVIVMPNSVGVGSSGAVCGLFGAKMAEAFCRMCESQKSQQAKLSHDILCDQFGSVLCSVILILAFSFIPYVDWAAHVGGLIGGFAVGMLLFSCRVKTRMWKILWFLVGFIMTGAGLALGIVYMNKEVKDDIAGQMKDVCKYYQEYFGNLGEDYECRCMLAEN